MNLRVLGSVVAAMLSTYGTVFAQTPAPSERLAERFVDSANGVSLEQAIDQALRQEPSLRAARSQIDVADGMRAQAALRPNPTVSFERRDEPGGDGNQTSLAVQWPLDLFRRSSRVAVADREAATTRLALADRERLLASEVRERYGDVLAAVRDLSVLDALVETTGRQHDLLRARADEGAASPLERDLLDVERRRLESERVLQMGRTEAALFGLKRVLGMPMNAALTVRQTLDTLVERESSAPDPPGAASERVDDRADVREAETRVAVADAKIESALDRGRLDLSVFAGYMRMNAGFPQRALAPDGDLTRIRGLFHNVAAGAMIMVPLLDRSQGEIAAARAERIGAAAAYDAARLSAEAELAAARTQDMAARQAVATYAAGARQLARQNLTVVGQSYELGRVTVFEVLAEQRRYLDVEQAYTDALRAAYEARTALNRARGDLR